MDFFNIKPYVRHAERISENDFATDNFNASYDHILIYILSGNTKISVEKESYSLSQGNILFIKPGYFYSVTSNEKCEFICIHFDFGDENSIQKRFYIAPETKEEFKPGKICENEIINNEDCFNDIHFAEGFNNLEESFKQIVREFKKAEKYFDFRISCILISVLIEISRQAGINGISSQNVDDTGRSVLDYIHKNYHTNISVESLSEQFKFHSTYLNILVKKLTGYPIHKYIMVRRISKAIELLQYSDMRISEIAEKVGFPDASHFSKVFKQLMGKGPREFRKNV